MRIYFLIIFLFLLVKYFKMRCALKLNHMSVCVCVCILWKYVTPPQSQCYFYLFNACIRVVGARTNHDHNIEHVFYEIFWAVLKITQTYNKLLRLCIMVAIINIIYPFSKYILCIVCIYVIFFSERFLSIRWLDLSWLRVYVCGEQHAQNS